MSNTYFSLLFIHLFSVKMASGPQAATYYALLLCWCGSGVLATRPSKYPKTAYSHPRWIAVNVFYFSFMFNGAEETAEIR